MPPAMPMDEEEEEDQGMAADDSRCMVALYEFDPDTIDWPFKKNDPLRLEVGQKIEVITDDNSGWVYGCYAGQEEVEGYFPKNFTVTFTEYMQIMEQHQAAEYTATETEDEEDFDGTMRGPPETTAMPGPFLPPRGVPAVDHGDDFDRHDPDLDDTALPELVYPGIATHPVLNPNPPMSTTYEVNKSRMLRNMPAIPKAAPAAAGDAKDDILAARMEIEREMAEKREQNVMTVAGGKLTDSRQSTPATTAAVRREKDFVRPHINIEAHQQDKMKPVPTLVDLVEEQDILRGGPLKLTKKKVKPYQKDLRVRSATCRIAQNIEPAHMRAALLGSANNGARWTQMFRPGFNDIVNETFKCGANACILSKHYLNDRQTKEQFQWLHIRSVNGILNFELQRRKNHCFYMRMDSVDVMMSHPDAWAFPDVSRMVSANPGEPINPFHGWYAQAAIDADKEMEDVDFSYTLVLRMFPESVFQALALGKVPEWIQPYLTLRGEAKRDEINEEDDEETGDPTAGDAVKLEDNLMLEAGLSDQDDLYVKLDDKRFAKERTAGPDVLDTKATRYTLKGLSAMRIFLRSRGQPDNMKQAPISPKMVKDMSAQLGIRNDPSHYWYCMFALRYPLAPDWEAVVRNDTRFYLHLPSDRMQPVHPMIRKFREHLRDCIENEFLWDFRGFVTMKCSECGVPDSVVWCQQCTDFFCAPCFLNAHRSKRGSKHCPMPIPGCRYLKESEASAFRTKVPLLNVGFSNRRRFLARDNQSDKMGSTSGDTWLFFSAETFQAALAQAPDSRHWYLKRGNRLEPDATGYYYNFGYDVIADDDTHILAKTSYQEGYMTLQRFFRGHLARKKIRKQVESALVIQKSKKMWDCQKQYGSHGRNAAILKGWYRRYKAREDRRKLESGITKIQARWRSYYAKMEYKAMKKSVSRIQAMYRGRWHRKRNTVFETATRTIQRIYRGHLYGRRPVKEILEAKTKIMAMFRGVLHREKQRELVRFVIRIQQHVRGLLGRVRVRRMRDGAGMIQRNWRRFQASLDVKMIIYERLEHCRLKRQEMLRAKRENVAARMVQRTWRMHREFAIYIQMKREKGEADRRISTMLVALYIASANIRHHVHPWFRYLPPEMQEVLAQIKASLQRTIGMVRVQGKMANEELGKMGLRVKSAEHLTYTQDKREPDPASHMLMSVTRHLLSHVPAELFGPTVKWACYAIGHQAVGFHGNVSKEGAIKPVGVFPRPDIQVGRDMAPHPGDTLATFASDTGTMRHHHDFLINAPDESLPGLMLNRLPTHHRHVYLTAQTLITMRQALDSPTISTEDHLRFQGLDAVAGAQLMEVLSCESETNLPPDWPKTHGTVAALAAQWSTHMSELKADSIAQTMAKTAATKMSRAAKAKAKSEARGDPKLVRQDTARSEGARSKAGAKAKSGRATPKTPGTSKPVSEKDDIISKPSAGGGGDGGGGGGPLPSPTAAPKLQGRDPPECGILSVFTRAATLRILQQVGFLMRDQDHLLESVVGRGESATGTRGGGVRQSRFISVTDKLFEMADRAKHDHCSFVLAVVLYHMVLRGLHARVLYHRAATTMQKRLGYTWAKGKKAHQVKPAICIQRYWRGLRTALRMMRREDAAFVIQNNYRAYHWNRRSSKLLKATLLAQRCWLGSIHRAWLRECHGAAACIQRHVRGFQTRVVYAGVGRELIIKYQKEMNEVLSQKGQLEEDEFTELTQAIAERARNDLDKHRRETARRMRDRTRSMKAKASKKHHKLKQLAQVGKKGPVRASVFEPVILASRREDAAAAAAARYGAPRSRVLNQCATERTRLMRILPNEARFQVHPITRRGRAAVVARRLAKRPKETRVELGGGPIDENLFRQWQQRQFAT